MKQSTKPKVDDDTPPPPTQGVIWARENRSKCNNLTDEQRADLMAQAMVMIYGERAEKASAHRR
jgi:hypothetical protein